MRMIKVFDSKDYSDKWKRFKRDSVRAIIISDEKIAMIRSGRFGEYKFPGGGIETGESLLEALEREVKEETGLHIVPSTVEEFGKTLIIRKGTNPYEIFEQESFYFTCGVRMDVKSLAHLDAGYETEYGYNLVYASLPEAVKQNTSLLNNPSIPWVERDLFVLHELQRAIAKSADRMQKGVNEHG